MKYILKCVTCGREYEESPKASTCAVCGSYKGTLDVIYPISQIAGYFPNDLESYRNRSVFEAFEKIFPFHDLANLPPVPVGQTPFYKSTGLARHAGIENLYIKDDSRNPSASFKDRASAIAIAMAKEAGAKVIAAASTGNAASSLATLSASSELKAVLFVPFNAPRPKLAQILMHGGHIIRLACDYDTAFDLCQDVCLKLGWYNRNTAVNPYTGEGKKSAALEIVCELGGAPEAVICPVGDGCIYSGLYKGFCDLFALGLIERIPRLFGIQAAGASPLAKAFSNNTDVVPWESAMTIADSICVGRPRDAVKALRAATKSRGAIISVNDENILTAQRELASIGSIFVEPAAAAAYAGLLQLSAAETIKPSEKSVLLITGHGLKDIDAALKNAPQDEEPVEPNIDAIIRKIEVVFGKI